MKVVRGVHSAAVTQMTAKRSPIGNAAIFLIQITPGMRLSNARQKPRMRRDSGRRALRRRRRPGRRRSSSTPISSSVSGPRPRAQRAELRVERPARLHPRARGRVVGRLRDRRLRRVGDVLPVGRAVGEVERVAQRLECQRRGRQRPDLRAVRADREPGEGRVLLRAVEDGVEPRAELREGARVAGELAVDAVGDEREVDEHRADDVTGALAGGERGRAEQARCTAR